MNGNKEWKVDDATAPWNKGWRRYRRMFGEALPEDAIAPRWWLWAWSGAILALVAVLFFVFLWIDRWLVANDVPTR
jgi:hypothetical protein